MVSKWKQLDRHWLKKITISMIQKNDSSHFIRSEITNFIAAHHLSKEQIKISLPKFNQYRLERTRFENHDQAYIAKGYQPLLVMNEGYADVAYKETKELIAAKRTQAISDRINVVSLPRSYKNISFDDINLDDVKRLDVLKG